MKLPTADIENLTYLSSATEHNEQNQRELMINKRLADTSL